MPGGRKSHLSICCADEAEGSDLHHVEGTHDHPVDESGEPSGKSEPSDKKVSFSSICCEAAGAVEDDQVRQFQVDADLHNFLFSFICRMSKYLHRPSLNQMIS